VLENLIRNARQEAKEAASSASSAALVFLLALVATVMFTVAAFVWLDNEYGAVAACVALGALYFGLAISVSLFAASRRRTREREREARELARQALLARQQGALDSNWLTSPAALSAGADLARRLAGRTDAGRLMVSAIVLGLALVIAFRKASRPIK
jgi:hypothetical protein